LQKSMDFTPLLPSAGPTGGDGEAWPAPTMSLTICSLAKGFLDMLCGRATVDAGKGSEDGLSPLATLVFDRVDLDEL